MSAGFQECLSGMDAAQAKAQRANDARQLAKDTKWVNRVLAEMTTNVYHDSVPLDKVNQALHCHGFDELEPMLLCGREGRLHENVGRNRWLALTWYKMESGRYEVVAYVS
jgi:hypothetical protein